MFHWVKDLTRKGNFRWWAPGEGVFDVVEATKHITI